MRPKVGMEDSYFISCVFGDRQVVRCLGEVNRRNEMVFGIDSTCLLQDPDISGAKC